METATLEGEFFEMHLEDLGDKIEEVILKDNLEGARKLAEELEEFWIEHISPEPLELADRLGSLLIDALEDEWENMHHNASISSHLPDIDSEEEWELFWEQLACERESAIEELQELIMGKFDRELKFYQYGRGGATIAPDEYMLPTCCNGFGGLNTSALSDTLVGLVEELQVFKFINRYWAEAVKGIPEWWEEERKFLLQAEQRKEVAMGQYWRAVNLDKREYLDPFRLGSGSKLWEQLANFPGVGTALVVLTAAQREVRGGGDLDMEENWHGREREIAMREGKIDGATPGAMPDDYPEVARRTIGRWAGDRIAIVGDYATDDDLPPEFEASKIYSLCSTPEEFREYREDYEAVGITSETELYKDITDDVARVIEHELGGVFVPLSPDASHIRVWRSPEEALEEAIS